MKGALRLITICCYFLPCTFFWATCNNVIELRFAYNQQDAEKNIADENESLIMHADTAKNSFQTLNDTNKTEVITTDTLAYTNKNVSDMSIKSGTFPDNLLRKIVMPTNTSLSGIGTILYFKNLPGKIVMGFSLAISLILLIAIRYVKSRKAALCLPGTNTLCLVIFLVDGIISQVTLLYGAGILFLLLLLQFYLAGRDKRDYHKQR